VDGLAIPALIANQIGSEFTSPIKVPLSEDLADYRFLTVDDLNDFFQRASGLRAPEAPRFEVSLFRFFVGAPVDLVFPLRKRIGPASEAEPPSVELSHFGAWEEAADYGSALLRRRCRHGVKRPGIHQFERQTFLLTFIRKHHRIPGGATAGDSGLVLADIFQESEQCGCLVIEGTVDGADQIRVGGQGGDEEPVP